MKTSAAVRGFTLIEMMVVVVIVGILASAAMPLAALHKRRQQEFELRENLRVLRRALDDYKRAVEQGRIEHKADTSSYPPTLRVLVDGVTDIASPQGAKLYFLRRLPRNPLAPSDLPPERTWATRAYDSPPEQPAPGRDVFDVYVEADGNGLDGTPYRSW